MQRLEGKLHCAGALLTDAKYVREVEARAELVVHIRVEGIQELRGRMLAAHGHLHKRQIVLVGAQGALKVNGNLVEAEVTHGKDA